MAKCQGRLTSFYGNCGRAATVEREGKSYCWQHDPERREAANRARWEEHKLELARKTEEIERRVERRKLEIASGINGLTNEELAELASWGGVKRILAKLNDREME